MSDQQSFEDEYYSVLLSIESAVAEVYKTNPQLLDFNVDKALNGAVRTLNNQKRDRKPPTLKLKGDEQLMYDRFLSVVAMYSGESEFTTEDGQAIELEDFQTYSIDELIACFKRIQRSIKLMSDQGRQGYLDFIKQFFGG